MPAARSLAACGWIETQQTVCTTFGNGETECETTFSWDYICLGGGGGSYDPADYPTGGGTDPGLPPSGNHFDVDGDGAEKSTFAWSLHPDDGPGYSTLLGSTADGERLLATRLFGLFDVVGRDGDVLWSFDPRDPAIRQRLPEIDFGRVQPFLRGDGVVELTDGSGRGRYLLSWPDTASDRLGTPRITWQPAG